MTKRISTRYRQRGVTIVELMVSILIGSLILAGVVQLYANSTTQALTYEGAARIQENSLYAFSRIEQDVIQAGANGCFGIAQAQENGFARFTNALTDTTGSYDFANYVSGVENTGTNNSDELFIRYADKAARIPITTLRSNQTSMVVDNTDSDYSDLQQYQIVFVANCSRMASVMITNDPATSGGTIQFDTGTTASGLNAGQSNSALVTEIGIEALGDADTAISSIASLGYIYAGDSAVTYTIGDSASGGANSCSAANPQNCSLFRNGLEIVEGVEDLEIIYGWENAAGNVVFGTWADVSTAGSIRLIDRVNVSLTFNSIQRAPTLDGDGYLSKTISRTFMIRNRLPAQ